MPRNVDEAERREIVAAAAARVIARRGVEGATIRGVAAEAGLSTGALTHYFGDKRELLLLTFRVSLGNRRRRRHERRGSGKLGSLLASLEGVLLLDDDARLHWLVLNAFCGHAAGDPVLAAEQREAYREYRGVVIDQIEQAQARGEIAQDIDALFEAEQLIAVADGIALQALFDPDSWPAERQRAHLRRALDALPVPVTRPARSRTR